MTYHRIGLTVVWSGASLASLSRYTGQSTLHDAQRHSIDLTDVELTDVSRSRASRARRAQALAETGADPCTLRLCGCGCGTVIRSIAKNGRRGAIFARGHKTIGGFVRAQKAGLL